MQQQIGRWILLGVLAIGILVGWTFLQRSIWPPKPKEEPKEDVTKKEKQLKLHPEVEFGVDIAAAGFDPVWELAWLGVHAKNVKPLPPLDWRYLKPANQLALLLTQPFPLPFAFQPGFGSAFVFLTPPETPETLATLTTIGGPDYFIEAKLTSRGAGVRQLTLTQFEAANYLGKGVKDEKLELIQEDPFVASFLMYHYPDPEVKPGDPYKAENAPVLTLGVTNWKLVENKKGGDGTQRVVFSTPLADPNYPDYVVTKTYELSPRAYHLGLTIEIANRGAPDKAGKPRPFRYQLAGSHGMPLEGEWYTPTQRVALIALVDDRQNVDRNKQDVRTISFREGGDAFPDGAGGDYFLRYAGVAIQFFASVITVDDPQPDLGKGKGVLAWARPTLESEEIAGVIVDVSDSNIFFAAKKKDKVIGEAYLLLPRTVKHLKEANLKKDDKAVLSFYETPDGRKVATWIRPGNTPREQFNDITVRVNSEAMEVKPGKAITHRFVLYHGPVKTRLLGQFSGDKAVPSELVEKYTDKLELYTLTDYRSQGFFGWLSQKIMFTNLLIGVTNLMHTLLYWLHFLCFGSYGVAIILLTVLVRGMMFPISRRQAQFSMKMQQLTPELKKIQEKYKGDAKAKTQATMEFYRKHKINPFASCLPLLLQMPIFLGLYFALQESIHFRLAGFLWIDNLAAPDMLIYWSQSIPWVSDPDNVGGFFYLGPYFNLLPICAVLLMVVQQKMMAPPAMDDQQAMQMKIMKFMMIFMGIIFYKVAAGLALYFIASSLWGVAERKLLPKKGAVDPAAKPGQPPPQTGKYPMFKGGPKGRKDKEPPKVEATGPLARLKKWWQDVLKEAKKK